MVAWVLLIVAGGCALARAVDLVGAPTSPIGARLGGEGSVEPAGNRSFGLPAANLGSGPLRAFALGRMVFNADWNVAPGRVLALDGLGPLFNDTGCVRCHPRAGRGQPPRREGALLQSLVVRLSVPGSSEHGGGRPHPVYGEQMQDDAVPGLTREAEVILHWREIEGCYASGEPYSLIEPEVEFRELGYGPLGDGVLISLRIAPAMIGLGLLEAVPDTRLLALADPEDRDGNGISGRPNFVWDPFTASYRLGRFGWKAGVASLRTQAVLAAALDMGIASRMVPRDDCTRPQFRCLDIAGGGRPEISDAFIAALVAYTRSSGVPLRRGFDVPEVRRGERLFEQLACDACHLPTLTTGDHELAALAGQTIHPFTDLLLHDMGQGLADGRPDFAADGREWRTAPLWGLGLIAQVNGHSRLLHDGRARDVEEAILWHGGEADAARRAFEKLSSAERAALIGFLGSL